MTDTPQHPYIEKLTWDREADAAYLYLRPDGPREAAQTLPVDNNDGATAAVLDFAADGTLLGVELLNAAVQLTSAMKAAATDITRGRAS
jgi:uncharacterized protein YuzE